MTSPIHPATIARLRELIPRLDLGFPDRTDAQLRICSILVSDRAANLRSILDQLDAQATEIERLNKGFHESCIAREEAANARAKKAEARVAELKGLLREIRDSYHDNRAGGWPGAGDVFADAICRIDAALSKREGGR